MRSRITGRIHIKTRCILWEIKGKSTTALGNMELLASQYGRCVIFKNTRGGWKG